MSLSKLMVILLKAFKMNKIPATIITFTTQTHHCLTQFNHLKSVCKDVETLSKRLIQFINVAICSLYKISINKFN